MNQAQALYRLQEIEQKLIKANKRLKEIAAELSNDAAIAAAQNQLEEAQKALTPLQTRTRDLELEIQSTTQKIKIADETLYSGRINNPKVLQELQQEIAALERRKSELEDDLLNLMMQTETAQNNVTEAQTALQTTTETRAGEHRHLIDEQTALQEQAAALRKQREAAMEHVTPENFQIYRSLMAKKNNIAVASLEGQSCAVCRIEQTMNVVQDVRRGQSLVYCLNCGRILIG